MLYTGAKFVVDFAWKNVGSVATLTSNTRLLHRMKRIPTLIAAKTHVMHRYIRYIYNYTY